MLGEDSSALRVLVVWAAPGLIPRSARNARHSAATWKASDGAHFVDSSRIRVPSGYSQSSTTILRANPGGEDFSFSTKTGPRSVRSSRPMPSGACAAKKARCSLENSLRSGAAPAATSDRRARQPLQRRRADVAAGHRVDLDHAHRRLAHLRGSSEGTTGRSLTTESSPFCAVRRARTTRPWLSSFRSGVSKKDTRRTRAPSGSMPRDSSVERCRGSAIVTLSSTLSASSISDRASRRARRRRASGLLRPP